MLTEDDVTDAVQTHLCALGWTVLSRVYAHQRGDDLVVERDGHRLVIEAKGEGSSKPGTARYGSTFDSGQVFSHVAKAVLKGLRAASTGSAWGAIALPDTEYHREEVALVQPALSLAGVGVFWVSADGTVTAEAPWSL
jgi:hypothetical protein